LQSKEFGFNILNERNKDTLSNNNEESGYTVDAQIMQSILEYSIDFGIVKYFKSRDLSKDHLLVKCKHYIEYYRNSKINKRNRPENMNPKVVELLEKLKYLELVEAIPSESKNHELTEKYKFTKLGRMVAFLLLCNRTKIDKETGKEVVYQIYDYYNSLNNSHSKFCLIFLKHCKINNYFDIVLNYMIDILLDASVDKYEFLNKIKFLNTVFFDLKMWKIFEKSLEHLSETDYHTYELFLFHLKLYLEDIEEAKSRKFKDFEIKRLEKSQELDTIVLEGCCSSCKNFTIKPMKITDYFDGYIKSYVTKRYLSYQLCSICSKGYLNFEQIGESQSSLGYFDNMITSTNQSINEEENLIKKIFEFNQNEKKYTEKAQQYQWIIRFLYDDDTYRNITETQYWVLPKVPHLFNVDVNDPPYENKKRTNGLFNRHLDKLEKWHVIESIPDESSRGGVKTRKFRLSVFGKMVASMIETILNENKSDVYGKLFDLWKSHLIFYPSSLYSFCTRYLDKCKEKGLFDEFVNFYIKSFTSSRNQEIQNTNDLFTQMILVTFEDDTGNSILFDIWKQSFGDLDENTRQLFSHYMKIYLNRTTLNKVFDFGKYEQKRFEIKDKIDKFVVKINCLLCTNIQYIAIDVISYVSYLFGQLDEKMQESLFTLKCQHNSANISSI